MAPAREDRPKAAALAKRLELLRRERGWSVNKLARESGVALLSTQQLLKGRSPHPTFWSVVRIATALGVSLDELTGYPLAHPAARDHARQQVRDNPDATPAERVLAEEPLVRRPGPKRPDYKGIREKKGLPREALARMVGIEDRVLAQVELGITPVSALDDAQRWSYGAALGITIP